MEEKPDSFQTSTVLPIVELFTGLKVGRPERVHVTDSNSDADMDYMYAI